jgi:hypothetical protein
MIDINKNGVFLTPNKWSYEERRLYKSKGNVFFEKNYSKWATIEVDKFEDIDIISETTDNDYLVQFFNDTHYIDAEDTYYEYWWGNKSLKKKFDEETDGYGRIEDYIDDDVPYMVRNTAVISKKDYKKLKEVKDDR